MARSVDIVLDDVEVVTLGELQQAKCGALRDAVAGRVPNDWSGDAEPGLVAIDHLFKPLQIGSGRGPGDALDGSAEHPHVTECLVVARVVHEYHVIGSNQVAAHEVDRSADAAGDQDLVRVRIDTEVLQTASHILAQRGASSQIAVAADEAVAPPDETCRTWLDPGRSPPATAQAASRRRGYA